MTAATRTTIAPAHLNSGVEFESFWWGVEGSGEVSVSTFNELTGGKSVVVPNGVDPVRLLGLTESIADLANAYDLFSREIVLLHPTRLLKRKNVELGLRVTPYAVISRGLAPVNALIAFSLPRGDAKLEN